MLRPPREGGSLHPSHFLVLPRKLAGRAMHTRSTIGPEPHSRYGRHKPIVNWSECRAHRWERRSIQAANCKTQECGQAERVQVRRRALPELRKVAAILVADIVATVGS
jgi:hypothetical protein